MTEVVTQTIPETQTETEKNEWELMAERIEKEPKQK